MGQLRGGPLLRRTYHASLYMAKIIIQQFSCIDDAEIDVKKFTVLIGPQASGKSIISKLIYYFYHCISQVNSYKEEPFEYKTFVASCVDNFKLWFPPPTWGKRRFRIEFSSGDFQIIISRTTGRSPSKNVKIFFSDAISGEVERFNSDLRAARSKKKDLSPGFEPPDLRLYQLIWSVQDKSSKRIGKLMGDDAITSQLFVPAGRSFFTSLGKAFVAFEQGRILDPITMRFGRYFSGLRDGSVRYYPPSRDDKALNGRREDLGEEIFGGRIRMERDDAYVETNDGRIIPFPFLSSGQQELLPLWLVLEDTIRSGASRQLIYIEEPEAHLFPSAQEAVVEFLSSITSTRSDRRLFITTHSPYVLAKINNLLKAGSLARQMGRIAEARISAVAPKESWLAAANTAAYAIVDRKVISIMGEDGLVDGNYLDSVSEKLSDQFMGLLDIEISNDV